MAKRKSRTDESHPAEQYARDVVDGRIVSGRLLRLACERHLRDLDSGHHRGLWFDRAAAQRAIDFYGFLRHSKGEWAGRPFALEPWQQFAIWCLFGWKRGDGFRRFRTAYAEICRKNGKSTISAGTALYLFFADNEPGAEVYAAATKRDQARIVHSEAVRMVRASPSLAARIGIYKDNLHVLSTASKFEPLGAAEDTADGLNIHGAIIDELHAHRTRGLYDVLETATGARRQPLIFSITTAGFNRQTICYELRDYGVRILEQNTADDSFFPLIYTIDDEDDWQNEAIWIKANPNLGVSVKLDDLQRKALKAREVPAAQNNFRRLHLNQWTEQATRWLSLEVWRRNSAVYTLDDLAGQPCVAGLDLSTRKDLTALCLAFPASDKSAGRVRLWPVFFLPTTQLSEREAADKFPYGVHLRNALIVPIAGEVIDFSVVRRTVNELAQRVHIQSIAYDPWNAEHLAQDLAADGFTLEPCRQRFSDMSEPTKQFEALLLAGSIAHPGSAVLDWCAGNVVVVTDASENLRPTKDPKKTKGRIDGIVAAIMALGQLLKNPPTSGSALIY